MPKMAVSVPSGHGGFSGAPLTKCVAGTGISVSRPGRDSSAEGTLSLLAKRERNMDSAYSFGLAAPRAVTAASRSVERGIDRHAREQCVLAALAPEGGGPEIILVEGVVGIDRLDDPGLLLQLGLELVRRPPGVAGIHPRAAQRRFRVVGIDDAQIAGHEARRVVGILELAERDDRLRLDRAAHVYEGVRLAQVRKSRHGVAHRRLGGAVEHDAHGALLVVLQD